MNTIKFTGWKPGMRKVSLCHLLRDEAGMTLADAKSAVDAILRNEEITIRIESDKLAERIYLEALALGAECQLIRR